MIAVKIQCNCGQKYAFDVEPVGNSLPAPVACPVCGADGTGLANQFIAQRLTMPTAPPANAAVRVAAPQPALAAVRPVAPVASVARVAAPTVAAPTASIATAAHAPSTGPAKRLPGQLDPERAIGEARSKIMWGDDPKQVMMFLRGNGFSPEEASATVNEFISERTKTVRAEGVAKLIRGGALMCVPVFALIGFLQYRFFPIQVLGVSMMIGCYGFYLVIKGLFMMIAPKAEGGDVADQ